jgi:class 3 adenylate cyclase
VSDEPQAATHLTGGEDGRAEGRPAPEHRTFLIADIRGYTPYTDEFGDEAAAALARRFAELAREAVQGRQGTLLELRGDEAVAHFGSARQALRAAVDLQGLVTSDNLPRRVGIGLDTGEAVAVDEGYRGTALNIAARLCAVARPGQIIATETVIHLAARIDGVRYGSPRSLRLKGLATPVRVVDVIAAVDAARAGDGRPRMSPFIRPSPEPHRDLREVVLRAVSLHRRLRRP